MEAKQLHHKGTDSPASNNSSKDDLLAPKYNEPPNGGTKAWLQVVGAFFLFFNSWGILNSYGAFESYYTKYLLSSDTSSSISWIGSVQGFLLLFIGAISGPLYDAGYFHVLITFGSFLVVFGLMMTSLGTTYYQILLSQGICIGIGCGCLFIPAIALVGSYFSTRKSFAVGILTTGASISGIIYPIVFDQLLPRIGFGWTTRVLGFIALGTLSISHAVMRPRVVPLGKSSLIDSSAFHDISFLLFSVGLFLTFLGLYVPFFYLPTYAVSRCGLSNNSSVYLVAIINASSTFGRIIPNYFADIIGPLSVIAPCVFGAAVLGFAWIGISSSAGIIIFCIIYGFFAGAIVSLPANCIFSLTPNAGMVGTRLGMCFTIVSFGLLAGDPIAGAILGDEKLDYQGVQLWCGVMLAAGSVLIVVARGVQSGWKLMKLA